MKQQVEIIDANSYFTFVERTFNGVTRHVIHLHLDKKEAAILAEEMTTRELKALI